MDTTYPRKDIYTVEIWKGPILSGHPPIDPWAKPSEHRVLSECWNVSVFLHEEGTNPQHRMELHTIRNIWTHEDAERFAQLNHDCFHTPESLADHFVLHCEGKLLLFDVIRKDGTCENIACTRSEDTECTQWVTDDLKKYGVELIGSSTQTCGVAVCGIYNHPQ